MSREIAAYRCRDCSRIGLFVDEEHGGTRLTNHKCSGAWDHVISAPDPSVRKVNELARLLQEERAKNVRLTNLETAIKPVVERGGTWKVGDLSRLRHLLGMDPGIEIKTTMGLDDEGPCAYYAKGHHDPEVFLDSLARYLDEPVGGLEVQHGHWRWIRVHGNPVADYRCVSASPGSRGGFAVTYIKLRDFEL